MIHFVSCEILSIDGDDALLEIKYRIDASQEVYQYQVKQDFSVEEGFVYVGIGEVIEGHRPGWSEYASDHDLIVNTLQGHFGHE